MQTNLATHDLVVNAHTLDVCC